MSRTRIGRAALSGAAAALACCLLLPCPVAARPLGRAIPGLFGGELRTTIIQGRPPRDDEGQPLPLASRFLDLNAALAASLSQLPAPSSGGAFAFAWRPELDTFEPVEQSLGPLFSERARTLGRGVTAVGVTYTRFSLDTFEGDDLGELHSTQPALSEELRASLPPEDQAAVADETILTELRASLKFESMFLTATYGLLDSLDLSASLSVNRAEVKASAFARIENPRGRLGTFFAIDQTGLLLPGESSAPGCGNPYRCAADRYSDSAAGTGDVFLRAKWHAASLEHVDLALAGILTIPTGNADDLLGLHDPSFEPLLIASKNFGWAEPHVNLGYALRSGDDTSQAHWTAGADLRAFRWLTLAGDFIGYHDDRRDGVNDDVIQAAAGLRVNPVGKIVFGAAVQFPVNRDGLRADAIYTGQVQGTF